MFFQFVPQRFSTFHYGTIRKLDGQNITGSFTRVENLRSRPSDEGWSKFEQWMRLQFVGGITYIIKQLLFQILKSIRWTCMSLFYFLFLLVLNLILSWINVELRNTHAKGLLIIFVQRVLIRNSEIMNLLLSQSNNIVLNVWKKF